MQYSFWNKYDFITYDLKMQFDMRLQNVIHKIENFFKEAKHQEFDDEYIEFYLAGSCIKADTFRDIDIFLLTQEQLNRVTKVLDDKYFLYKNNSNSYIFKNDTIQLVYRKRFLNKPLSFVVDIFDFYSTKIAFKCILNTKKFEIEVVELELREEFILYLKTNINKLTRVNTNPFVSLQRGIHFLKRGDDVPFSVFLKICAQIALIDKDANIEKYFDRLQGDEPKLSEHKEAITEYIESLRGDNIV